MEQNSPLSGTPSKEQQQWGALISIVIIVAMIVAGAFYAWGQRIAEQDALNAATGSGSESTTTAQ